MVSSPVVILFISVQADFVKSEKYFFDTDANDLLCNLHLNYEGARTSQKA